MSVSAFIRDLMGKGFTMEQALVAAEAMEASQAPVLTKRQARNQRYYENNKERLSSERRLKASERLNSDGQDVSDGQGAPTREPTRVEDNLQTKNQAGQKQQGKKDAPAAPPSPKRGAPTRISEDFEPDLQVALKHGFTMPEAQQMASDMRDWFLQTPGSKGLKADWPATWRTWCSRAARDRADRKVVPFGGAPPSRAPTVGDAAREKRLELEARSHEPHHSGYRRLEAGDGNREAASPGMPRSASASNAFLRGF